MSDRKGDEKQSWSKMKVHQLLYHLWQSETCVRENGSYTTREDRKASLKILLAVQSDEIVDDLESSS